MKNLTEETFLLYAAKHYDNPQLQSEEEFYDDLKKFKYIGVSEFLLIGLE